MKSARAQGVTRRCGTGALLVFGAVLAAACASSPEPAFYALSARSGSALSTRPLIVELRRPTLPAYLDRPYLVRRATAERLALDGSARWGAPLQELVVQTLSEDLSSRLPHCFVGNEASALAAQADVRVDLAFSRFELESDGAVALAATVALRRAHAAEQPDLRRYDFRVASGPSAAAIAAGLSDALARLSDEIAQGIARAASPAQLGGAGER